MRGYQALKSQSKKLEGHGPLTPTDGTSFSQQLHKTIATYLDRLRICSLIAAVVLVDDIRVTLSPFIAALVVVFIIAFAVAAASWSWQIGTKATGCTRESANYTTVQNKRTHKR